MNQKIITLLFALVQSAMFGRPLSDTKRSAISDDAMSELLAMAKKHDIAHLVTLGLDANAMLPKEDQGISNELFMAVYRYEQLNHELKNICKCLETAEILFIPLKGSVLRHYYPKPWMRTSCDIDILVHPEDLDRAVDCLKQRLGYCDEKLTTHDVSMYSPSGQHIELHFDLGEEGRAKRSCELLKSAWEYASPHEGCHYRYDMSDAFFYFYHVAHMAKHFENGGCGIRPLIDLWILDHIKQIDEKKREMLLEQSELLTFAKIAQTLSCVWMENAEQTEITAQMEQYILSGGVYGSAVNRIAVQQQKHGRFRYLLSRIFLPYDVIKYHYPVLQKHRWLTPVMEVRRWLRIVFCDRAKHARQEFKNSSNLSQEAESMKLFLNNIGL